MRNDHGEGRDTYLCTTALNAHGRRVDKHGEEVDEEKHKVRERVSE